MTSCLQLEITLDCQTVQFIKDVSLLDVTHCYKPRDQAVGFLKMNYLQSDEIIDNCVFVLKSNPYI